VLLVDVDVSVVVDTVVLEVLDVVDNVVEVNVKLVVDDSVDVVKPSHMSSQRS
jgi:hypothetical protein